MSRYVLQNPVTKTTKKALKKFASQIPVSNQYIRGVFTINNYRKYQFSEEIDVQFKGEIFVMWNRKRDWYDASLMTKKDRHLKPSIIKVNRFIRKNIVFAVRTHLRYFDIELGHYSLIQKLKWL